MNRLFLVVFALVLAVPLAGCQSQGVSSSDTLKIGAYSVVREVIHDGLIPAFAVRWKSKTGREVQFEESYDASSARPARSPRVSTPTWRSCRMRATWTSSSRTEKSKWIGAPDRIGAF